MGRKNKITSIARTYETTQVEITNDLKKEFTKNLQIWNAVLDSLTLSIRFENPEILFNVGSAELNDHFKSILDSFFPRFIQMLFQLRRRVEMVFNGSLGMAGNNENLLNAAGFDFFHNVLDGGLVHNRKHFLGHGLGLRKETGVETGCRNDCFSDFLHVCTPFGLNCYMDTPCGREG